MGSLLTRAGLGLLVTLGTFLSACEVHRPEEPALRILGPPAGDSPPSEAARRLVESSLSEVLGVPVSYRPGDGFAASVVAFRTGEAELVWLGGVTGLQAREGVGGARVLATGTVDARCRSSLVARADAETDASAQGDLSGAAAGRRVLFGSTSSTSGYVMPGHLMYAEAGVPLERLFAEVEVNGGGHGVVIRRVLEGEFDAGVVATDALRARADDGLVELWRSPPYANLHWLGHPRLTERHGEEFMDRLRDALVALDDPLVLDALGRPDGFVPAGSADFDVLHGLCEELGLLTP